MVTVESNRVGGDSRGLRVRVPDGHALVSGYTLRRSSLALATVAAGVVLSVATAAFGVSSATSALRSAGPAGAPATQTMLKQENRLVEQQRAAVAAYAAKLAEYNAASARPPGAVGINSAAAEAKRRDGVLAGLVLDCISAVDRYNLAAQALSATQLRSAGLPERLVWASDCAAIQGR